MNDSGVASLREATSYTNPDEFSGDASIVEIPDGISSNSTHLTYTFLCKGCVVGSPTTFKANADTYFFGWALAKTNPTTPSSPSSVLSYHAAGFGTFEMLLSEAKLAKYSTWAAKARSTGTASSSASPSSSTPLASATPTPSVAPTVSNATYDYIVVGGGAAGIIAAERLTENKKKVLLIERGSASIVPMGADNTLSWNNSRTPYDVPALGSSLSELGLIGDYLCPDTAGMAGCVLGGSTIINALAFIHPQTADFDDKWTDVSAAAERLYERNAGSLLPSADGVLGAFFVPEPTGLEVSQPARTAQREAHGVQLPVVVGGRWYSCRSCAFVPPSRAEPRQLQLSPQHQGPSRGAPWWPRHWPRGREGKRGR